MKRFRSTTGSLRGDGDLVAAGVRLAAGCKRSTGTGLDRRGGSEGRASQPCDGLA
ncbi:MAG: hypothetical protein NXI19_12855 [Alphaproteobacteria bacterium]|nr:hypothetical protein [Alphaproteobacteria bacterium]